MKGKITITRQKCGDGSKKIVITLENENYHYIGEMQMTPEEFSLALTGLACRDCELIGFENSSERK